MPDDDGILSPWETALGNCAYLWCLANQWVLYNVYKGFNETLGIFGHWKC